MKQHSTEPFAAIAAEQRGHVGRSAVVQGWLFALAKVTLARVYRALPVLFAKMQEEDKIKHMVWSFWLTTAALLAWSPEVSFVSVFLLGLAKECWDKYFGSGFCLFDMAGNFLGSLLALAGYFLLARVLS